MEYSQEKLSRSQMGPQGRGLLWQDPRSLGNSMNKILKQKLGTVIAGKSCFDEVV